MTRNKIADKTTSSGKSKECHKTKKVEEIYILPEKGQQIINDLRLFYTKWNFHCIKMEFQKIVNLLK